MKKETGMAVGAGAFAVGAAAAGYYFYASKDAKANRKIAATWAADMKKEVVSKAQTLGALDRESFMKIIDRAAELYNGARKASAEEILHAATELKANYDEFQQEMALRTGSKKKKVRKTA